MGCLSIEDLEDLEARRLSTDRDAELRGHLAACADCTVALAELRANDELAAGIDPRPGPDAATTIPGYVVGPELHRGGQGVIHRAVQTSTGRTVALKLMIRGRYSSSAEHRRFEREVETAASLRHPGLVTVFDGGTTSDGTPWLAMELVDGERLDRWSRRSDITRADRLRAFMAVCDAVHHAHLNGIIHRDLKPANVLVDRRGDARVVDFGLARRLGGEHPAPIASTLTGEFVGTLAYAAPEQLGDRGAWVDARADVHAAGVMLYELLTGVRPHATTEDLRKLIHQVTEVDPVPPSAHDGGISSDFDTIALKALAKDPARRYQSMAALAEDVRHAMVGLPIAARRDDRWYVVRRFVARNRWPVAAVVTVVAALAVSTVVALVSWREAEVARGDLTQSLRVTEVAHERAVEALNLLRDGIAAPRPTGRGPSVTMVDFIESVLARLDASPPAHAQTEIELRGTLAESLVKLSRAEPAREQFLRAAALARKTFGDDSPMALELEAFAAETSLALARGDETAAIARPLLPRLREVLGASHPRVLTLELAVASDDARTDPVGAVARLREIAARIDAAPNGRESASRQVRITLASVLGSSGHAAEAEAVARKAIADETGETPAAVMFRSLMTQSLIESLANQGRFADALPLTRAHIETFRQIVPVGDPKLLWAVYSAAVIASQAGQPREALARIQEFAALDDAHPFPDRDIRAQMDRLRSEIREFDEPESRPEIPPGR